jgi:hypothetical protein
MLNCRIDKLLRFESVKVCAYHFHKNNCVHVTVDNTTTIGFFDEALSCVPNCCGSTLFQNEKSL